MFLHDKTSKKHLVEKYDKLRQRLNGDMHRIMEAVSNGVVVDISPVPSAKKVYSKTTKNGSFIFYLLDVIISLFVALRLYGRNKIN